MARVWQQGAHVRTEAGAAHAGVRLDLHEFAHGLDGFCRLRRQLARGREDEALWPATGKSLASDLQILPTQMGTGRRLTPLSASGRNKLSLLKLLSMHGQSRRALQSRNCHAMP